MLFDLLLRSVAEEEQIDGEIWCHLNQVFFFRSMVRRKR